MEAAALEVLVLQNIIHAGESELQIKIFGPIGGIGGLYCTYCTGKLSHLAVVQLAE